MTEIANDAIIRSAYEAYAEGDLARMLQFVDPDLEWTYLDPADEDPQPQVGRRAGPAERTVRIAERQGHLIVRWCKRRFGKLIFRRSRRRRSRQRWRDKHGS
jgi:ketosteroid isomerase-like protein